jgi:hypothetical protein
MDGDAGVSVIYRLVAGLWQTINGASVTPPAPPGGDGYGLSPYGTGPYGS